MEELFSVKIRKIPDVKYKIISVVYEQEKISTEKEKILQFVEEYKKNIIENKDSCVIMDLRKIKKINYEFVWKNINKVAALDDLIKENVKCIVYIINSSILKSMSNTILKVYKPVVDIKICTNNKEALEFIKKH